jgi:hypothetical protein
MSIWGGGVEGVELQKLHHTRMCACAHFLLYHVDVWWNETMETAHIWVSVNKTEAKDKFGHNMKGQLHWNTVGVWDAYWRI